MRRFLLPGFALVRLCLYYGRYVRASNALIYNPALCEAIIGLIAAKMNYPLLYVFFIVSACCTCSCYSLNSVYDLMVLTGNIEPLFGQFRSHFILHSRLSSQQKTRKRPDGAVYELFQARTSIPLPESRPGPRNIWHYFTHDCDLSSTQVRQSLQ